MTSSATWPPMTDLETASTVPLQETAAQDCGDLPPGFSLPALCEALLFVAAAPTTAANLARAAEVPVAAPLKNASFHASLHLLLSLSP